MDDCDQRQKSRCKKALMSSSDNCELWWWYYWLLLFSLKLGKMIQAIKDLANALVPSGKLILLVDTLLVPVFLFVCLFFLIFILFLMYEYQILTATKNILFFCVCFLVTFRSRWWWTHSHTLSTKKSEGLLMMLMCHSVRVFFIDLFIFHFLLFKVFKVQLTFPPRFWAM